MSDNNLGVSYKLKDVEGTLVQRTTIKIPQHIIKQNRELKDKRSWRKDELLSVARVPMNLAMDLAKKYGIRFEDLTAKELLGYLRAEGMGDFITYSGSL